MGGPLPLENDHGPGWFGDIGFGLFCIGAIVFWPWIIRSFCRGDYRRYNDPGRELA
jgi:hypothetical protein